MWTEWKMWKSKIAHTGKCLFCHSCPTRQSAKIYPQYGMPLKVVYCGYCGYCYKPSSLSPILKISPAPIVINRSSGSQFSNKKISIASKDGK